MTVVIPMDYILSCNVDRLSSAFTRSRTDILCPSKGTLNNSTFMDTKGCINGLFIRCGLPIGWFVRKHYGITAIKVFVERTHSFYA